MSDRVCIAGSILDYLTVKNPKIRSEDQSNVTQSSKPWWSFPTHVEPWDDFEFETMEQIFDGLLMQECRDDKNRFHFLDPPLVPGPQDEDSGETAATIILNLWTNTVVNKALLAIQDTLHPVQWAPQSSSARTGSSQAQLTSKQGEKGTRAQPIRSAKASIVQTKSRRGTVVPDASGIAIPASRISETEGKRDGKPPSKLPKEIKPGSKWVSRKEIGSPSGKALGWIKTNRAAPLRQIYEQCIQARSRYGCIVTTKEAVVVRIGPHKRAPSRSRTSKMPPTQDQIAQAIIDDGLLEYKSISWDVHRRDGESLGDFRTMTMNLAIWFQHVLAGNNHELDWEYRPLKEETLRKDDQGLNRVASQASQTTQDSQGQLVVELPSMSSFISVAQSDSESQEMPLNGYRSMSYLQTSFATESDLGESPSTERRQNKRSFDIDAEVAESSPKRRGRGRPRKEA